MRPLAVTRSPPATRLGMAANSAEEEVGEEVERGGEPEVEGRAGEAIDQQRQDEDGDGAAEVGDRLAGPELPEVGAERWGGNGGRRGRFYQCLVRHGCSWMTPPRRCGDPPSCAG